MTTLSADPFKGATTNGDHEPPVTHPCHHNPTNPHPGAHRPSWLVCATSPPTAAHSTVARQFPVAAGMKVGHYRSMIVSGKRVLLARHGQTEWNLLGRRQGQLDSRLTERGVEQARRNAAALNGHAIDTVFTSPLGRAVTTAQIFADTLGGAVVVVEELAEVHHGDFAGLTDSEIEQRHFGEWDRRARDKYHWRFPGGESYADADRRAAEALTLIDRHPADRPLIISHAMISKMLLRQLLDLEPHDALTRRHPHDVVYEVDCRAGSLRQLLPTRSAVRRSPGPTGRM